jgi:kinesin family member 11
MMYFAQAAAISNSTQAYQTATTTHVSSVQKLTESLVKSGTKDDPPTQTTPRKRAWDFTEKWELTKSRETLLEEWRQKGRPNTTFLATRELELLPESGEERIQEDMDDMMMAELEDEGVPDPESPEPQILEDDALSHSSLSPSTTPIPQPSIVAIDKQSGVLKTKIPSMGTLTERPLNIPTRASIRRLRG